ncbi:MAG: hypothetical protein MZV65_42835 [Chromatiales bacterium]|nr:hypothetical protein [Chromatiales bacterium]
MLHGLLAVCFEVILDGRFAANARTVRPLTGPMLSAATLETTLGAKDLAKRRGLHCPRRESRRKYLHPLPGTERQGTSEANRAGGRFAPRRSAVFALAWGFVYSVGLQAAPWLDFARLGE